MSIVTAKGEKVIQRYPIEVQRPRSAGFTLMKTTGTCMTNRDEPEEEVKKKRYV